MDVKYIVVKSTYYNDEEKCSSFGIAMAEPYENENSIIKTYPDLSNDECKVREFVNKCNENKLSPIHFKDAVEDFLVQ